MRNPFLALLVYYIDKKFPLSSKSDSSTQKKSGEPRRKSSRTSSHRSSRDHAAETRDKHSSSCPSSQDVPTGLRKRVNSARSTHSTKSNMTHSSRSSTRSTSIRSTADGKTARRSAPPLPTNSASQPIGRRRSPSECLKAPGNLAKGTLVETDSRNPPRSKVHEPSHRVVHYRETLPQREVLVM